MTDPVQSVQEVRRHFDEIAHDYEHRIPLPLQRHYLDRKLRHLAPHVRNGARSLLGLDLGSGLGFYAREVVERYGVRLVAADASIRTLRRAYEGRGGGQALEFAATDAVHLPFRDASFDFAYAINLVHHLAPTEQPQALKEVARVLRPGAPFFLFEINTRNALFRWYLRNVFPRRRRIDRGDEAFVHPDHIPKTPGLALEGIDYFTFLPDFLPAWTLSGARLVESWMERSPLRRYSIHYVARHRKIA